MLRLPNFFVLLSLLVSTPAFAMGTVTVLADTSMNIAVTELARDYSSKKKIIVSTSYAHSDEQETKIIEGEAADILITPKHEWIEALKTQGLVDIYSQAPIARNRLALIAPVKSTIQARISEKFPTTALIREFGWQPSFLVGNPESLLEGVYGKEALRNLSVASDLEEYTLYVKKLSQMFDLVSNHGMYGIFFYSSTIGRSGIRVIDLLPENTHKPIEYSAVVIAGDNMDEARKFLAYLQTDDALKILRNNGFSTN